MIRARDTWGLPVALLYRDDYIRDLFVAEANATKVPVAYMGAVYGDSLPEDHSGSCRPIMQTFFDARYAAAANTSGLLFIIELPQNWMLFNCVTLLRTMWPKAMIAVRAPGRSSFLASQLSTLSRLVYTYNSFLFCSFVFSIKLNSLLLLLLLLLGCNGC